MRFILFIGFVFFVLTSPLKAMVQTDTHTYILDVNGCNLLAIDRKTDDERCLHLRGFLNGFSIHKDKGYIVDIKSDSLIIIDLPTFIVLKYLKFGCTLQSISIQNGLGYLDCYDEVRVFDLENEQIVQKIPVKYWICFIEIQGTKGYVGHMNDDALTVIDFSLGKVTGTIKVGRQPKFMMVHKGKGNVSYERGVAVIDLEKDCILFYLDLKQTCKSWVIQGDYTYGVGLNTLYRIDLGTHKVRSLPWRGMSLKAYGSTKTMPIYGIVR